MTLCVICVNHCFAKLKSGDRVPGFILPYIVDGRKISLTHILNYNKPVVVSFFATWCKPCLQEIPHLQEIEKKKNVKIYLVNIDNLPKEKITEFLKQNNIILPVLLDPNGKITGDSWEIMQAGGVASIPKLFLISPSGVIKYISGGFKTEEEQEFEEKLTLKIQEIEKELSSKPPELAVFFTNSTNGFFESCDCPTHPYGGIVRRATYLTKQRQKYPLNLLLDSGDILPPYCTDTMAEYLFKCYQLLNYDAVAIGDQELSYPGFVQNCTNYQLPFISGNINYCEGDMCRFIAPHDKIIEKPNLKIAILSVTDEDVFALYPEELLKKLNILAVKDVLAGFLSENKRGVQFDLLILLSHSGLDIDKKIAEEIPEIDVIVGGHSQTLIDKEPLKIGKTFIVQAGQDGQNIGKLVLKFDITKKIASYQYEIVPLTKDIPDDPQVRNLINEYKQKIKK
ncbi:MAG: redoxin domain-containing protein [Elusimicrobiota bacterium]